MKEAREHRPAPSEPTLAGVAVATFDNLQMNVDYSSPDSSFMVEGDSGQKLDMTNWFTTLVPRRLALPGFDTLQICQCYLSLCTHS